MIDLGKHNVLGVRIDAVDYDAAVARVRQAAVAGRPLAVSALAVHGVMTGACDAEHRYRLNRFDMLCPDGQPVRRALAWLHGVELADRVYGPDLMLRLCHWAAESATPVFLFGGSEPLLGELRARLVERFPRLAIAGARASRFRQLSAEERDELVAEVRNSGASLVFVGLGCPRQEVFVYEMRRRLGMPLLAIGAAFAFHSGRLSQAPPWMQRRGLEWLHRLTREPLRLWRRYLLLGPVYLILVGLQAAGLHRPAAAGRRPRGEARYG